MDHPHIRTPTRLIRGVAGALLVLASLASGMGRARPAVHAQGVLLREGPTSERAVALTFDDGPSLYTARIVSALDAYHAHATFFVIGEQVAQFAAELQTLVRAGDEVGNHTYTHANLTWLAPPAIGAQLAATQQAVYSATGVTPRWFRPPDGAYNASVVSTAVGLALHGVLWSVDPRDWTRPGTSVSWRNGNLSADTAR